LLSLNFALSQNTVGLIEFSNDIQEGYNLFYPNKQSDVFLVDNCGRIVHTWADDSMEGAPGVSVELFADGTLLRASKNELAFNSFGAGGRGGVINILDWDGSIQWERIVADSIYRQHHEVTRLPDGNVLLVAWRKHNFTEIVNVGFDTINNNQEYIWTDSVFEIDPITDSIVWEWHAWDHLIQDFDETKLNYGDVKSEPGKLDINYTESTFGTPDLFHVNSIDYNDSLDQILLSSKHFNEIWIIDHNLTSTEAQGPQGDLIYRWGNPATYKSGTESDKQCFYQHDAEWIDELLDDAENLNGSIRFFNNDYQEDCSIGNVIKPLWNNLTKSYELDTSGRFLPESFFKTYQHPIKDNAYSTVGSSIQHLPNGNVLLHSARHGRAFELNPEGDLVWEYLVPMKNGIPIEQGFDLSLSDNFTFQMKRYDLGFQGFENKTLTAGPYLELNPDFSFCQLTDVKDFDHSNTNLEIYPNPVIENHLEFFLNISTPKSYHIFSFDGSSIATGIVQSGLNQIEIDLLPGLYLLSIPSIGETKTFLKI